MRRGGRRPPGSRTGRAQGRSAVASTAVAPQKSSPPGSRASRSATKPTAPGWVGLPAPPRPFATRPTTSEPSPSTAATVPTGRRAPRIQLSPARMAERHDPLEPRSRPGRTPGRARSLLGASAPRGQLGRDLVRPQRFLMSAHHAIPQRIHANTVVADRARIPTRVPRDKPQVPSQPRQPVHPHGAAVGPVRGRERLDAAGPALAHGASARCCPRVVGIGELALARGIGAMS
jgi:hypothetical protein